MPVHVAFLIAGCASLVVSLPLIVRGWVRRVPNRRLASAYYTSGYLVMAAGYLLDSVSNPPLFVHGFVPGIGVALVVIGLALIMS
ncbi:MAG TPA: hypothetical protein VF116_18405 [Ktedonobacterales bacterium]